jgi:predicted RecA/RadA family phage recombinase
MKNYVQPGNTLTLIAPYAVASGAALKVGLIIGVAATAAGIGATVEADTVGVFTLAKATGAAWTVGALLYWDDTAKNCTTTAASNQKIGVAVVAAGAGDTTGVVKLIPTI